jgi:hypothetical protein
METKSKNPSYRARVKRGLIPVQVWMTPELRQRLREKSARTQWSMSALAMLYIHDGLKAKVMPHE